MIFNEKSIFVPEKIKKKTKKMQKNAVFRGKNVFMNFFPWNFKKITIRLFESKFFSYFSFFI